MGRKFQRRIETFTCLHCGSEVHGNGYTNHCPNCLFSRHVDIFPGDRAETCGGLMQPVRATLLHGELIIEHRCIKCGYTRKNKSAEDDNKEILYPLLNS